MIKLEGRRENSIKGLDFYPLLVNLQKQFEFKFIDNDQAVGLFSLKSNWLANMDFEEAKEINLLENTDSIVPSIVFKNLEDKIGKIKTNLMDL